MHHSYLLDIWCNDNVHNLINGRVLEDAVERNPWGKSSCDMLCRFPNTGGLHLTSGDAPLDTQNINYDN